MPRDPLDDILARLASGAAVLDVGCAGWRVAARAEARALALRHAGCDIQAPAETPPGALFRAVDLDREPLPFADDSFDLVVAAHVIEHLRDPLTLFAEALRVARPGGLVWVSAPSERALWPAPGIAAERHGFLSHFDDPTHHGRPWSPGALYRLAIYHGALPLRARHLVDWRARLGLPLALVDYALRRDAGRLTTRWWWAVGFAAELLARKRDGTSGRPAFRYFSLESVPPGAAAALAHYDRLAATTRRDPA